MSFNKRYISKDLILSSIKNIDIIFRSDALILDDWSSRFCDDLRPVERKLRRELIEKYNKHNLNFSYIYKTDPIFNKIYSLSECLISLFNNPSWFDIIKTNEILKKDNSFVGFRDRSHFENLVNHSIIRIIEYYDKPNRNDKIEEILK